MKRCGVCGHTLGAPGVTCWTADKGQTWFCHGDTDRVEVLDEAP